MSGNRIIGYTAGVFDLFHIGHLNIIRRAKENCDYLIVAISTDELVGSYKKHFPVFTFEERTSIVEALKYVDEVVPQTELNKLSAWSKYHFDKIFVGDDWKNTPSWNEYERKLNAVGSQVIYFPRTEGISTSILREKLLKL